LYSTVSHSRMLSVFHCHIFWCWIVLHCLPFSDAKVYATAPFSDAEAHSTVRTTCCMSKYSIRLYGAVRIMLLRRARSITRGTGRGGPWKSRLFWVLQWLRRCLRPWYWSAPLFLDPRYRPRLIFALPPCTLVQVPDAGAEENEGPAARAHCALSRRLPRARYKLTRVHLILAKVKYGVRSPKFIWVPV
jgi:hypothetical protein